SPDAWWPAGPPAASPPAATRRACAARRESWLRAPTRASPRSSSPPCPSASVPRETPRTRSAARTDSPARRSSPAPVTAAPVRRGSASYQLLRVHERQAERLGHGGVDHASLDHVQALEQRTVLATRLLPAAPGQALGIGESGVGERQRG